MGRSLAKYDFSPETLKRIRKNKQSYKIRPSLTISKEGLKTFNIQLETIRI